MRNERFTSTLFPVYSFFFPPLYETKIHDTCVYVVSLTTQVFSFSSTSYGLNLKDSICALFQRRNRGKLREFSKATRNIFNDTEFTVFFFSLRQSNSKTRSDRERYSEHLLIMNGRTWRTWTTVHAHTLFTFSLLCHQTLIPI